MSRATFTVLDFSGEKSPASIPAGPITALSIAGFLTEFGQMRAAIDGITLGAIHKEMWVGDDTVLTNVLPTNAFAQRELKWLVRYRGNTSQKIFTLELPTADPTGRLIAGTDRMDLTETAAAAFVTRFNSFTRSPEDPNEAVTLMEVILVGRNI